MNRRIFIILTISVLTVMSIFATQAAQAQSRADTASMRCERATARIATRLDRIDTVRENRQTTHSSFQERFDEIITRAEANGYDTATLTAAQADLETEIADLDAALLAYNESLVALSQTDCTNKADSFVTGLTASRNNLREVRAHSVAVRATINNTVLPSLRDYASWLRQQTTSQENQ